MDPSMRQFVLHRAAGPRAWLTVFVPGVVLLAVGLAIAIWPQLLAAMVAAAFLSLGGLFVLVALKMRGSAGRTPFDGMGGWRQ